MPGIRKRSTVSGAKATRPKRVFASDEEIEHDSYREPEVRPAFSSPRFSWNSGINSRMLSGNPLYKRLLLGVVLALVVFLPLVVFPFSPSPREFAKQSLLVGLSGIGLILVLLEIWSKGKLIMPRHLTPLVAGVLGFTWVVSAFLSKARYLSFFGYEGQETQAVITGVALLFVSMFVLYLRGAERALRNGLILSFLFINFVSLGALIGIKGFMWGGVQGWNTIGSTTMLGMLVAVGMMFTQSMIVEKGLSKLVRTGVIVSSLLGLIIMVGTNVRLVWIVYGIGSLALLMLFAMKHREGAHHRSFIPLVGLAIALVYLLTPLPGFLSSPLEVNPATVETVSVVKQVLKASPIFGSGPATFLNDFLRFHSKSISESMFWNVPFAWGSSAALTFLATTGVLGFALFVFALGWMLAVALKRLILGHSEEETIGIFVSVLLGTVVLFVAPVSLSFLLLFVVMAGLLIADGPVREFEMRGSQRGMFTLNAITTIAILMLLFGGILFGRRALANHFVAKALGTSTGGVIQVEEILVRAARFDNWNDSNLRMLIEAERLVITDMQQKFSTAKSEDQQALLASLRSHADLGLTAGRRAIQLAPGVFANWNTLGNLYSSISLFTIGAADEAIKVYQKAQELNPNDPSVFTNLAIAQKLKTQADKDKTEGESKAIEYLSRAIEIQPAYALAHLELARLYAGKNDFEKAKTSYANAEVLFPRDPSLAYEIGLFYLANSKLEDAVNELGRAVRLAPNFSNARWYLAQAYETQGSYDKALEQVQKIVELNPENATAKERLDALTSSATTAAKEARKRK